REALSDDLFRLVTFDPPCAGIPRRDAAVRIEHEDRVVLYGFNEQAKHLFRFPRLNLSRHIEREHDDSFDLSILSVHRLIDEIEESLDRKSTRLNSSHVAISYAVF